MQTDFIVANHGTICLLTPSSCAGKQWANDHLPRDAMHWNGAVVVEPRYIEDIAQGIIDDGLTVEGMNF